MEANIINITEAADPRVDVYARLTEAQLRQHGGDGGIFIAESPKVIRGHVRCEY